MALLNSDEDKKECHKAEYELDEAYAASCAKNSNEYTFEGMVIKAVNIDL